MKKHILTLLMLPIIFAVYGQSKEFKFLPKWKVGEKKTISVVRKETTYKRGKLEKDTTIFKNVELVVLKEDKDNYFVKIIYPNAAMESAMIFYKKLGEELADYKKLELQYKINKQTGKAELVNWKEVQKFINQSFDQINALLKKKVPKMTDFAKTIFDPIREIFKSKENVESYMNGEIDYLLFPYGKKYTTGDTLTFKDTCPNPFNPKDSLTQATKSYLSNIDAAKKVCDINKTEMYDLTEFKAMMKSIMESMAKSFDAPDSTKAKMLKEIDNINFDMTNLTVITFNYSTTWPTKMVKTEKVLVTDPKGKTEKEAKTTVTIK